MSHDKMTERELCALIAEAERDSVVNSGSFLEDCEENLKYYMTEPFGDENEGESSVVTSDVRDLVESDMPSLARTFLGAGDPVEFRATRQTPEAIQEAKDKQLVTSYIIKSIPNSFRTQHDWLKSSEIYPISMLEYGVEEVEVPRTKTYSGLDEEALALQLQQIEQEDDVDSVKVVESDDKEKTVTVRITQKRNQNFMRNIPVEDIIISRNAWNKDDADVIGKRFTKTRSQLISEGFDHDLVDSLPAENNSEERGSMKNIRYDQQGGNREDSALNSWANEEVSGEDVYIRVDYDGDGIAERRHVIKVGNTILVNEPFDHVPYAVISSMLMPNNIVGLPRAELAKQYQRVNSTLRREILNNIYAVNHPRTVYGDGVDVDDLLDIRLNGIIYSEQGINAVQPLVTPYIGDKALQVVAYMDGQKQASTGAAMANQALQADNLHKETATRFDAMDQAAAAKIELVARVIAETGYRDLWEGIAWFATHYQDSELEFNVLGREMVVDPRTWKYDHRICALVGTGAGDDEKILENLNAILQMQMGLIQQGSPLADIQKVYNTLAEMTKVIGRDSVEQFFNNPEMPEQMITAERDILKQQVAAMGEQLAQSNPLAEAEQVKAQAQMQMQQMKQQHEAQIKLLEMQQKQDNTIRDMQAQFQKQLGELKFKYDELYTQTRFKYVELAADEGNSAEEVKQVQDSGVADDQRN